MFYLERVTSKNKQDVAQSGESALTGLVRVKNGSLAIYDKARTAAKDLSPDEFKHVKDPSGRRPDRHNAPSRGCAIPFPGPQKRPVKLKNVCCRYFWVLKVLVWVDRRGRKDSEKEPQNDEDDICKVRLHVT
jgi:hypothetical protein